MVLPLQMLSKATMDPEQQPCCREAECQHHLLPGEGPSRKGSIRVKTRWTKSHHPPCCQQALIQPGTGLCVWPQFRTRPFPFPLDFLSHSLRLTGKQQEGKTRIRLWNSMSGPGLPWETQLLTQESVNRWLKMSVINNFLFKKYQVKCKL